MKVIYNTNNTKRKLWIIGDSFTGLSVDASCWVSHILKHFDGNTHHVSSAGSRDVQTILDIFLRNLYRIDKNDLVILAIPTLQRIRLPRKTPIQDVELSNELFFAKDKDEYKDYFIGLFNYQENNELKELEEPLTGVTYAQFEDENSKFNPWLMHIINTSNANKLNFEEIITSLKKYLSFELYLFSWSNDFDDNIVECRNLLSSKFDWETLHDEYKKSDGKEGAKDDCHWSKKAHFEFANHIISKYPQYFQKEIINEIK
jgi:hypothetical protein